MKFANYSQASINRTANLRAGYATPTVDSTSAHRVDTETFGKLPNFFGFCFHQPPEHRNRLFGRYTIERNRFGFFFCNTNCNLESMVLLSEHEQNAKSVSDRVHC